MKLVKAIEVGNEVVVVNDGDRSALVPAVFIPGRAARMQHDDRLCAALISTE